MLDAKIRESLLTSRPFQYLESNELDRLLAFCSVVNFSDNEIMFKQGKESHGMYIIIDGKALVVARSLGKDVINFATLDKGNFVGETSLIEKVPSIVSVVANGPLQCLLISTEYFDMFSLFFPEIHLKITRAITEEVCSRIKSLHTRIMEIMSKSEMTEQSIFSKFIKPFSRIETIDFEKAQFDKQKLKNSDLFNLFDEDEYNDLLSRVEIIKASPNTTLISESEKEPNYFVILHGAVQSSIIEDSKVAKLSVLGPTELFGNMSYIDKNPSLLAYTTCENAILLKISACNLEHIQTNNLPLWNKLFDSICRSFVTLEWSAGKLNIRLNTELYNR